MVTHSVDDNTCKLMQVVIASPDGGQGWRCVPNHLQEIITQLVYNANQQTQIFEINISERLQDSNPDLSNFYIRLTAQGILFAQETFFYQ